MIFLVEIFCFVEVIDELKVKNLKKYVSIGHLFFFAKYSVIYFDSLVAEY